MMFNFFADTLRALGDSRSPLFYLLIASGLNIVLDIVFIRAARMGVREAALATICERLLLQPMPSLQRSTELP